ncbi:MAG TPA: CsbD family protein [Acidobacteriaceae bacterium]|nr:CsbD family protein [Acidobacteriaceae bacterium]
MNKDQVAGKVDQATGKVKQGVGEAVGNDDLANRGVADQVKGAAKETWGNVKDAANRTREEEAHDTRENISRKVEDVKNRTNEKIDAIKEQHRMNDASDRTA